MLRHTTLPFLNSMIQPCLPASGLVPHLHLFFIQFPFHPGIPAAVSINA
jgi:hypothetical protein